MKKQIQEYKKEIKYFINNKIFIIAILLVTLLSFGFTITNSSMGVDDTAFDRYYEDKEMISIGRWGAYLIYRVLGITEFTPFWADLVATSIIVCTAILWCVFLKKNINKKIPLFGYITFATIYISFPVINEIFIYQNCNIAVMLGNFLASAGIMIFYENYINIHKKSLYLLEIIVLTFAISTYEACFQIMILASLATAFLILYNQDNKKKFKNIVKYAFWAIVTVAMSIALNSIIVKLTYLVVPISDVAEKEINWGIYSLLESIKRLNYCLKNTIINIKYFPVLLLDFSIIIGFVISIIQSYKNENPLILILYVGMVISNFVISILQLRSVMYRTCASWGLFTAFILMVFFIILSKYKITKILSGILIFLIVMWQSQFLNQMFYNDYKRYERELNMAYDLIYDLKEGFDISKPLVITGNIPKGTSSKGSQVNGLSMLWWAKKAFNDNSAEFIKFLNSLGYEFKRPNDEQYEKGIIYSYTMNRYPQEGSIIELEDCIIINF